MIESSGTYRCSFEWSDAGVSEFKSEYRRYTDHAEHMTETYTGVKAVRPLPPKAFRQDGAYQNMLTKYGTQKDASEHYKFVPDAPVMDQELTLFYEQNGLFARIIDVPAEEAVKHGFELADLEDDDLQNFVDACLDELDWEETAIQSIRWARLYGGSLAVMLINDGRGLDEPLNWRKIKSIDDIRVYDRSVITPDYSSMYKYDSQDPFKSRGSRLGYPERYMISSESGVFTVHESRCLIFQNGVLPENSTSAQYRFWGIPEYVRVNRAVRDVEVAHGMATKLLDRSVQGIYKMQGLSQLLQTEDGEEVVLKRLGTIDLARGLLNSMILDADGEEYDFRSLPFTGVSDVINTTCNYLSALTNIPQTLLFGRSPAGMNATGSSDLENYYNFVERIQKRMLRSNLRYLITVICQAGKHTGEVKRVPHIDIEFNSLWSMTEQERVALDLQKAQVQSTKAQTALTYVNMQAIDPSEVRKKLAEEDEFDIETMLDDFSDEELEENDPSKKEEGMGGGMGDMMGGGGDNPLAALMGNSEPENQGGGDVAQQPEKTLKTGNGMPIKKPDEEQKENMDVDAVEAYRKRREARLAARAASPDVDNIKGNSPDAAPEATKLPQDMQDDDLTERENEDAEEVPDVEEPRPGVGVIVTQGNKILTATRIAGDAGGYGMIGGPGGHIEEGELPIQAARREAIEEFGILPLDMKPLGIIQDEDDSVKVSHIFLASGYAGVLECDDTEMRRPVWRDLEEMYSLDDKLFQPFKDSLGLLMEKMYRFDEESGEMKYTPLEEVAASL